MSAKKRSLTLVSCSMLLIRQYMTGDPWEGRRGFRISSQPLNLDEIRELVGSTSMEPDEAWSFTTQVSISICLCLKWGAAEREDPYDCETTCSGLHTYWMASTLLWAAPLDVP
jgi:hypothetical protein